MERIPEPEIMDMVQEAQAYAQADFAQVNQAFVDRLLELAGDRRSALALDMGTGPADIPIRLVRARPAWHVTAVDASGAMLDIARKAIRDARIEHAIELVQADAKSSPLKDASFDVIFSNSILHHISAADAFWNEVRRLLAPGARVLLRDLTRPESPQAARQIVELHAGGETPLLQEEYYRSLLSAYTVHEVRDQLTRAGLGKLEVERISDRHMDVFGTASY
jgi:ubiquinone/menaquinone biosynthesis C-methylase UbiE